jgi:hypothetical protein
MDLAAVRRAGVAALIGLLLASPATSLADVIAYSPPEVSARVVGLDAIGQGHRRSVEELLNSDPLHIRITTEPFRTTTRVYEFLLERLPLASTIGRALKLSPYIVKTIGPKAYWSTDQKGLKGTFDELVAGDGRRVYLARGRYDGRWLRGLTGRAVIVLRYEPISNSDGQAAVANNVHFFVRMDDVFFQAMARILGSLLQGLMEGKLRRAVNSAKELTERLASDPQSVYKVMSETSSVTQDERQEFARLFLMP